MRQLYLDCDGVLADFDRGAVAVLGMKPKAYEHRHGLGRFWSKLAQAPDFYFSLPLLPDAMQLFDAVKHLDPIILTGLPRGNWAAGQKMRWAEQHFAGWGGKPSARLPSRVRRQAWNASKRPQRRISPMAASSLRTNFTKHPAARKRWTGSPVKGSSSRSRKTASAGPTNSAT
jgi:hypothetical protein